MKFSAAVWGALKNMVPLYLAFIAGAIIWAAKGWLGVLCGCVLYTAAIVLKTDKEKR